MKAIFAGCLVALIWSGWINLSRLGVQTQLTPADITLLRFATATLFSLPFFVFYRFERAKLRPAVLIALSVGFPYTLLSFYGLITAKAASVGVLVNGLMPVLTLVLGITLFARPFFPRLLPALLLILGANVLMLLGANQFDLNLTSQELIGYVALFGAALLISANVLLVAHYNFKPMDILVLTPITNLLLFLPLFTWFALNQQSSLVSLDFAQYPWSQILLQAGYQGILVSLGAVLLMAYCSRHAGALTASVIMSFVPVITAIMGVIAFAEALSMSEIIALVLCSTGLMWYALSQRKLNKQASATR